MDPTTYFWLVAGVTCVDSLFILVRVLYFVVTADAKAHPMFSPWIQRILGILCFGSLFGLQSMVSKMGELGDCPVQVVASWIPIVFGLIVAAFLFTAATSIAEKIGY